MNAEYLLGLLRQAYRAGWEASAEGWNDEIFPDAPDEDIDWNHTREVTITNMVKAETARLRKRH